MERKIDIIVVGDIQTNCWFYLLDEAESPQPCAVIDPGDEAELIISRIRELNCVPRYILLTHGHFDHLAALAKLFEACGNGTFGENVPLPKVCIHRQDAQYVGKDALAAHRKSFAAIGAAYVEARWEALPEADTLFEEGDMAGPLKVLHVPGHTPGSVCFYDEEAGVLFSGDTLFRGGYGRTDLPGGDWNELCQSLKRLLSMQAETVVLPGHGGATTVREAAKALNGIL